MATDVPPHGTALDSADRPPTVGAASRADIRVTVDAHFSYDIEVRPRLLADYGRILRERFGDPTLAVLTDRFVDAIHGTALRASLAEADFRPHFITIAPGEPSKCMATIERAIGELAGAGFDRRGVLVNFGGGVVTDTGGFLASCYMRGVSYVNFATTLIGQLDASIGGKVAVNAPMAKNMIGAFHHPRHVAADPMLLATLDRRDMRSGLAEAIKVAIINGPGLFEILETEVEAISGKDPAILGGVVREAARLKMDLIAPDPYEVDLRRALNLGHTLGHPIETALGYRAIKHGEAVAVGIQTAVRIARHRNIISRSDALRMDAVFAAHDLRDIGIELPIETIVEKIRYVRLIRGKHLHFVLPRAIGDVVIVDDLSDDEIRRGFLDYVSGRLA